MPKFTITSFEQMVKKTSVVVEAASEDEAWEKWREGEVDEDTFDEEDLEPEEAEMLDGNKIEPCDEEHSH